jgi:hypothetical protein
MRPATSPTKTGSSYFHQPYQAKGMQPVRNTLALLALTLAGLTNPQAQDPLPSWNDTAPKKAIVAHVEQAFHHFQLWQRACKAVVTFSIIRRSSLP